MGREASRRIRGFAFAGDGRCWLGIGRALWLVRIQVGQEAC